MILTVVSVVFLVGYAILIYFYYRNWNRLRTYTPNIPSSAFLSVIIAARNEEETLPGLLNDLQLQDYPANLYEVIVVNDFSTDGTAALARSLPPNARMIEPSCTPEESSKKKAIAAGVAAAKGELILVTDADCRVGGKWVSTLAAFYAEKEAAFIAAPVRYVYAHSLLQIFQTLDFITLQGITAASVSAGVHSMCNGANLAYTKKVFEQVDGFAGIDKVPTGDDMLLMHKIWKKNPANVFYVKSKEAMVSTTPVQTWKDFFQQRRRWASKTLVYDDHRITLALGAVLLLNLLPFALLIAGFYNAVYFLLLLFFLLAKTFIEWPFVYSVAKFYGEQSLMKYFFFLQPLHVFYTVLVGVWSQVGTYEWKGRRAGPLRSTVSTQELRS
jgi:cellulose synthase/poly-beta-1,6-N-acetylglucosamine synthase-like glycosyltransferase